VAQALQRFALVTRQLVDQLLVLLRLREQHGLRAERAGEQRDELA